MFSTKIPSKIFKKIVIRAVSVAVIFVSSVWAYSIYGDFVDNKQIEILTVVANQETKINKSSTTTVPILVYHQVGENSATSTSHYHRYVKKFTVPTDVFEAQIKFIQDQGYTPLTMEKLIKDQKNNTLPLKPIAITFDDGWRTQYENALPILNKYHTVGTFYIYTGVIGSPAYMTWEDLHALVNSGMEIGDHTKNHPRLTKINPSKWDEEIIGSKKTLERNLHVQVNDFAFPYGNYNDKVVEFIKQAGYVSARTSDKGIYNDFKDLYRLKVIYAPSDLRTLEDVLNKY